MTEQQAEAKYNEWSQMSKKQLLVVAQAEAARHGIVGCSARDSKAQIMQSLFVWASREAKGLKVAIA